MPGVIYIFQDAGVDGCVKIGKAMSWPRRFIQAQSHTPRGIDVIAAWNIEGKTATVNRVEAQVTAALPRRDGQVREWFEINAQDARLMVADVMKRGPDFVGSPQQIRLYDDWRSKGIKDWRARLWLFEEESSERRLKLVYSCLNDTIYRYAFTYNPFPVFLVAAWELLENLPLQYAKGLNAFREHNDLVEVRWNKIIKKYNDTVPRFSVGWLNRGVTPEGLERAVTQVGFRRFTLAQPKPADASPRDASLNPPTKIGEVPPLTRVREIGRVGA